MAPLPFPPPGRCFGELPRCSLEAGAWLLGAPLLWAWQSRPGGFTSALTRTLLRAIIPERPYVFAALSVSHPFSSIRSSFLFCIFPVSFLVSISLHFSISFIFSCLFYSVCFISLRDAGAAGTPYPLYFLCFQVATEVL